MIVEAISRVVERGNLSYEDAYSVMGEIMGGRATEAQIASLITGLRMKGETIEEIAGFARAMREHAQPVVPSSIELLDTCGTGGDGAGTFNISTTAAFVAAGAGAHIAKHGNRSVSSNCGSADVLEALGINLSLSPEGIARCIDEAGIGFLFAPALHPAMKYAIGPRREIGIRSIFNVLGPLTNPAGATHQLVGVYKEELTETIASVLGELGIRRALVVHGEGGLDEISLGESRVSEYKDGRVNTRTVTPQEFGLARAPIQELSGGDAARNAELLRAVLSGEKGPRRDVVLLNAGAALAAAEKASDLREGVSLATRSIDSGAALAKLDGLVELSARLAG